MGLSIGQGNAEEFEVIGVEMVVKGRQEEASEEENPRRRKRTNQRWPRSVEILKDL
jgi:hypothetical protein